MPAPPIKTQRRVTECQLEAEREYQRVRKALGVDIKQVDESLLRDYAITHAEIIQLRSIVLNEGIKLVGIKGGEYLNPTVNVLMHKQSHLAALRRDLFFTPKSRADKIKTKSKAASILASLSRE